MWEREGHRNQGINKNNVTRTRAAEPREWGHVGGLGASLRKGNPLSGEQPGMSRSEGESSSKYRAQGQLGAPVSRTSWEASRLEHGSE